MARLVRTKVNYVPKLTAGERQMLRVLDNVRDLRPLARFVIAPKTVAMLRQHWNTEGAAFGHPWPPLAPSTVASKRRRGTLSKGILRDSGHLEEAIFRDRPTDSRLRIINGGIRYQLNTQVPYAIFLQRGTDRMPARQVFPDPMPVEFTNDLRATVRAFILTRSAELAGQNA